MKFQEISYSQVIATTKMELSIENSSDHDGFLLLMADEAMRQINDRTMFSFQTKDIPLDSGMAPVPCGFMRPLAVWYSKSGSKCTLAPYIERDIVDICGCDEKKFGKLGTSYQLNGGYITFHNPDAIDADEVSIAYWGMRLDDNHMPIVLERHNRGLRAYLRWKYYSKEARKHPDASMRKFLMGLAKDGETEFIAQKRYLKGKAISEEFQADKKSISRTFNAWIRRDNKRGLRAV